MNKDYQKWIVSTEENITFLHRCFPDSLDAILKEGLSSWSEDLSGTATSQPRDLREAENVYRRGKDHGPIVVVVQFPRRLYDTRIRGKNLLSRKMAYFHPVRKAFTVLPEFVTAWINRETDEVNINPYLDRRPAQGHEEFDFLFA